MEGRPVNGSSPPEEDRLLRPLGLVVTQGDEGETRYCATGKADKD